MTGVIRCWICKGRMEPKRVLFCAPGHLHDIEVDADVCDQCGERVFPDRTMRYIESLRDQVVPGRSA